MIQVIFKNLERSELVRETAVERIETLVEKFSDLKKSQLVVTLEMENSPTQAGPDLFTVKVQVKRGRYHGTRVEKSASNLYLALADVVDHLLELFNRSGDRARVKERSQARKAIRRSFMEFKPT